MEMAINIIMGITSAYVGLMIIYVIMSWIPALREGKIGQIVAKMVEPYLRLFDFIPTFGEISIAPIAAILVLNYASKGLVMFLNTI